MIGPNLRRDATLKVAEWVNAGGTLWTDAGGLSRDESDQENVAGNELLKVGTRKVEVWGKCPEYRATTLEPLSESNVPESSRITLLAGNVSQGHSATRAHIAREVLEVGGATVRANFADKQPAMIERSVGKGRVVVLGIWAGVSYSAQVRRPDFNMQNDFDPSLRSLISYAALSSKAVRPAVTSNPQVESVALQNEHGRCIALTNWSYVADRTHPRGERLQPARNLRVQLPADSVAKVVRSLQLNQDLPIVDHSVVLPIIEEIDVLVLE